MEASYTGEGSETATALGEMIIANNKLEQDVRLLLYAMTDIQREKFDLLVGHQNFSTILDLLRPMADLSGSPPTSSEVWEISRQVRELHTRRNDLVHSVFLVTGDDGGYHGLPPKRGKEPNRTTNMIEPSELRALASRMRVASSGVARLLIQRYGLQMPSE